VAKWLFKSMSWRDAPSDDAVFCQMLRRDDDGAPLGIIMRYENEDAPTYAWVRIGVTKAKRGAIECCFNARRLGRVLDRSGSARCGRAGARGGRFMRLPPLRG
jgi:hypothetical protein